MVTKLSTPNYYAVVTPLCHYVTVLYHYVTVSLLHCITVTVSLLHCFTVSLFLTAGNTVTKLSIPNITKHFGLQCSKFVKNSHHDMFIITDARFYYYIFVTLFHAACKVIYGKWQMIIIDFRMIAMDCFL